MKVPFQSFAVFDVLSFVEAFSPLEPKKERNKMEEGEILLMWKRLFCCETIRGLLCGRYTLPPGRVHREKYKA